VRKDLSDSLVNKGNQLIKRNIMKEIAETVYESQCLFGVLKE